MSAVSCLMIFCACGDLVAIESLEVGKASFNSLWYLEAFPLKYRKFNIMILAFAHQPIRINGLNVVQCSLSSFLSVRLVFYWRNLFMETFMVFSL